MHQVRRISLSENNHGRPVRYDSKRRRLKTGEAVRSNGAYVYRWTDRWQKRHAIYSPTLEGLREKEALLVIDEHDGIRQDKKLLTVNELYTLWHDLKRGIKDNTQRNYEYMYEAFVKETFGKSKVINVRKSDVRWFYNHLLEKRGLKINTLDGIHNILHQVFQVAVDDNIIRSNPTENIMKELKQIHSNDIVPRKVLTVGQQMTFFDFLRNTPKYAHWYPVFYIMANTGMRVGEITGLRWCDVNMERNEISVNHTLVYYNHRDDKGCYFSINTPKTKAGCRVIPMTPTVRDAFLMEREYQDLARIECKAHIDGYDDFIFINRFGLCQDQSTLNEAIKRIVRDCNIQIIERTPPDSMPHLVPAFSNHVLRHTFATRAAESGMGLKSLQAILGHTDMETTMNIYVDSTSEAREKDMASLSRYMEELSL